MLNRKYLPLKFDDSDDHTDDLLYWMEQTISEIGPHYNVAKMILAEKSGYEESYGSGTIDLMVEDEKKFINSLLGLGEGIPVSKFQFTRSRFGIKDKFPLVQFEGGIAHLGPANIGECEVRVRGEGAPAAIILNGKMFSIGMQSISDRFNVIRISTTMIEIKWDLGNNLDYDISFDDSAIMSIKKIEEILTIMLWFSQGAVDVQIWIEKKRLLAGKMSSADPASTVSWSLILGITKFIIRCFGADIRISARFISQNYDRFLTTRNLIDNDKFSLDFSLESAANNLKQPVDSIDSFIYSIVESIGDRIGFMVIHRPVTNFQKNGDDFHVEFGAATVRESYVVDCSETTLAEQIKDDFDRISAEFGSTCLAIHNIGYFAENKGQS